MANFDIKTKLSSLKIENVTVINLKTIAILRCIKRYNKLRKAELIHKLAQLHLYEFSCRCN